MRTRTFLFAAAALITTGTPAAEPATKPVSDTSPNIVYILADDLGYGDIQCLDREHGKIPTPNLDRLAAQGMVFTDAHSGSSVCTPSRYGILTGRYAWRTRLQAGVLQPYDPPLIAPDRLTAASLLQQHGYHTACIGKWHLGWDWPRRAGKVAFDQPITGGPTTRGFSHYFGTDVPNCPPFGFIENDRLLAQPTEQFGGDKNLYLLFSGPIVPGWQFDQILPRLVERSVHYLGERAADKKPFFLYLPLTSPHEPIAPSAKFRGKSRISAQADFIMETDWAVGQVVETLNKHGLAENTLVIFSADNGHFPNGVHQYRALKPLLDVGHRPSQRFRGYKGDIWDGGHRVPFIARWPSRVKAGSTCNQLICLTDLIATCAELLGVKLPDNAGEDSVSMLPALLGSNIGRQREAVIHHSWHGRFALRSGNWKLVLCPGSGGGGRWYSDEPSDEEAVTDGLPPIQLYDMSQDDSEKLNLYDKHPETVERLTELLTRCVADGRSTPGRRQENDVAVDIWKNNVKAATKGGDK